MNKEQTNNYIIKYKAAIIDLTAIQNVINYKIPSFHFLFDTIGNAGFSLTNILTYMEGKHIYYKEFTGEFFNAAQASMHRQFFADLHTGVEAGLIQIIKNKNVQIEISKKKRAESIVKRIENKIADISIISKEIEDIKKLVVNRPAFNDHLDTVLKATNLSEDYKKSSRSYFEALSIIRNKVSHSDMTLTDGEKTKLKNGKLGNAIGSDGLLQMTVEGYKPLITDVVRFFDNVHTNLI